MPATLDTPTQRMTYAGPREDLKGKTALVGASQNTGAVMARFEGGVGDIYEEFYEYPAAAFAPAVNATLQLPPSPQAPMERMPAEQGGGSERPTMPSVQEEAEQPLNMQDTYVLVAQLGLDFLLGSAVQSILYASEGGPDAPQHLADAQKCLAVKRAQIGS